MTPCELYTLDEAEGLKRTYSCWINKTAHIGNGRTDTLTAINVKLKRVQRTPIKPDKKYTVQFQFSNTIKLNAYEFLLNNGLISQSNYASNIEEPNKPKS